MARKFALFASAVPAALLALASGGVSQPPAHGPTAAEIEHAVARAHERALRAGGRPGPVVLATRGVIR